MPCLPALRDMLPQGWHKIPPVQIGIKTSSSKENSEQKSFKNLELRMAGTILCWNVTRIILILVL
jgi:hypothetical protein